MAVAQVKPGRVEVTYTFNPGASITKVDSYGRAKLIAVGSDEYVVELNNGQVLRVYELGDGELCKVNGEVVECEKARKLRERVLKLLEKCEEVERNQDRIGIMIVRKRTYKCDSSVLEELSELIEQATQ